MSIDHAIHRLVRHNRTPKAVAAFVAAALVAALLLTGAGLVVGARAAHANQWHGWCVTCHFSSGYANRRFGPSTGGNLVRTTNYSTGSARAGTGIDSSGYYDTYCSTAGCTADTGSFSCGSWFAGATPFAWDHSSWADTFTSAYYTC